MARITIEIDDAMAANLERRATADGTTVEALVIEASARFLHTPASVAPEVMEIIHRQIADYRRVFDRLAE